jgi:hypothetical protein
MNDFSELENELKKLRPLPPSAELFSRVEQELVDTHEDNAFSKKIVRPDRFKINWLSVGTALAAAAVLLIVTRINLKHPAKNLPAIASVTPAPNISTAAPTSQFIPAGATQVVYHTRDEGLVFPSDSAQPVRRLRSMTRETQQWRNPATGASLRVSYPSEQVELIPVSGQ